MAEGLRFEPGTLWARVAHRSQTARARGALRPIETEMHIVEDRGVHFQVRVVSNLVRKKQASTETRARDTQSAGPTDPFLPYEDDLYVADASSTYVCLLNKYNVIDHHLLIVTRDFERQETPLTERDFDALWICLRERDALGFYNSAPIAGASQPHKHLQLVPLPLGPSRLPIQPLLPMAETPDRAVRVDSLPFVNAYASLDADRLQSPLAAATYVWGVYRSLLVSAGLVTEGTLPDTLPAYNLLATREFIWLIPRSRSHCGPVSVNALAFAGSFFVTEPAAAVFIRETGPIALLGEVTVPLS